jgi:hypothetical protein
MIGNVMIRAMSARIILIPRRVHSEEREDPFHVLGRLQSRKCWRVRAGSSWIAGRDGWLLRTPDMAIPIITLGKKIGPRNGVPSLI